MGEKSTGDKSVMKLVGLTGNIASGKSSVSQILKSLGSEIIDMDKIGKEIQDENYKGVLERIRKCFGETVIVKNKLDRKKLAKIVFSSEEALSKLNEIMIPLMTERLLSEIESLKRKGVKIAVVDGAILYEAGWDRLVDEVWVVYTPRDLQVKRLTEREQMTSEEANARIDVQMSIDKKIMRADFVIDNSGDLDHLKQQVNELWQKMFHSI